MYIMKEKTKRIKRHLSVYKLHTMRSIKGDVFDAFKYVSIKKYELKSDKLRKCGSY